MSLITSFVARCLHCDKAALTDLSFCQSCGCRRRDPMGCADNCTGFHGAPQTFLEDRARSCRQAPRSCTRFSNLSSNSRFISPLKTQSTHRHQPRGSKILFLGIKWTGTQGMNVMFPNRLFNTDKIKLSRSWSSFSISFCASPFSTTLLQTYRSTKSLQTFHLSPLIFDIN